MWLTKTVPTDFGWGIFWLRADPAVANKARLYYAHVDFQGQLTVGPMWIMDIPRIAFRDRYYNAAWNTDHYGLIIASVTTLYYYDLSLDGVLSGQRTVGPALFYSAVYDNEATSDFDSYPGGFLGVIEGNCEGHSCSYAFRLDPHGTPLSPVYNLVDFDFTHSFYPAAAYDGSGFTIVVVKDIVISLGGVETKYLPTNGFGLSVQEKVVPTKEYLWDEFPDIAWNGNHFASIWTENSRRSNTAPWQVHFASFRRTWKSASPMADQVLDVTAQKANLKWSTQINAVGGDWVVHYPRWQGVGVEPLAVFQLLDDQGNVNATLTPFTLSASALGSSVHFLGDNAGRMGIARGDNRDGVCAITFQTLEPAACR